MATDYSIGYLMYAGGPLTEATEIDWEEVSGDKPIETILKGRSGHSNGPESIRCTLKSAVPRLGFETPFLRICRTHTTIQLRFRVAGVEMTAEGRVDSVKATVSSSNPTGLDVSFDGKVIADVAVPT